jgi:hypothetical protein
MFFKMHFVVSILNTSNSISHLLCFYRSLCACPKFHPRPLVYTSFRCLYLCTISTFTIFLHSQFFFIHKTSATYGACVQSALRTVPFPPTLSTISIGAHHTYVDSHLKLSFAKSTDISKNSFSHKVNLE